ncbi:hypothetical protein BS47DRAFT_1184033 [Hydnum rufescens UP504]|uniref:Uncharacterized protein n=1 Tax=Hydnum rufescens UP504 TaxID=1448309 RepID=A0A9P6DQR1_9AGAM|nr:hypothetical protein BS47DRAFT_1184033 [Hydnum rufescens UP504]
MGASQNDAYQGVTKAGVIAIVHRFPLSVGTHMAFDEYVAAASTLTPPAIAPDSIFLNDVAPADRWNYDLLEANGIARMRQVAQDVMAMCQALNN